MRHRNKNSEDRGSHNKLLNLKIFAAELVFQSQAKTPTNQQHCWTDRKSQLTLFHHADVNAAFETTGLAVTPVVLRDGAAPVERTGEGGFTLHTAPVRLN